MFGDYQYIDNNETLEEGPTGSGVGVHAGGGAAVPSVVAGAQNTAGTGAVGAGPRDPVGAGP